MSTCGSAHPAADIAEVKYLVFDATGVLVASGPAICRRGGPLHRDPADATGKLAAGSNKLEVVVSSNVVSIPGIADYEFVSK